MELDSSRPSDRFDRFWLITAVQVGVPGNSNLVRLTLKNPTAVDPTLPNVTAPNAQSEYAITSLSANFFADEREQVDYLYMFDNDSVANDQGVLTSSDGAVLAFDGNTSTMQVETTALQAVVDLIGTDFAGLVTQHQRLEITIGSGVGSAWTIEGIVDGAPGIKVLSLLPIAGTGGTLPPNERSEFRIVGGDRHGRIHGFGMGPSTLFAGRLQGGGITYGDMEVLDVRLGTGDDSVRVDYATNAEDHTTDRSGDFYTLTLLDTGAGDDTVTVALDDGDGNIDGDGAFALNLGDGDDTVLGAASTRGLVVFGDAGNDDITTGGGDDILFGDIGRLDYTRSINLQGGGTLDEVITRLGHSAPQNPVNPLVTGATLSTLEDATADFPPSDASHFDGLKGLSVQVIGADGHVQFRTIVSNTATTITVDRDWDSLPVFTGQLSFRSNYRVSTFPDNQTDGAFREPRLAWTIDASTGGDDTIQGGAGADTIMGGPHADNLDGGLDADLIFGDNVRLVGNPGSGDAIDPRFRALTGTLMYGPDGLAQVAGEFSAAIQPEPGGRPAWADWTITLDPTLSSSPLSNDYIAGGGGNDEIFGQQGNDTIQGDGSIKSRVDADPLSLPVSAARVNGLLVLAPSFEAASDGDDYIEGNAGDDVIFGNLGQDDIIGGSSSLFSLTTPSLRPDGSDLIFGGSGTDVARNHPGDTTPSGHARDADVIVGDNGNVYRLVGLNGTSSGSYLTFNYDTYDTLRIIPRAAELLDYTPGGLEYDAVAAASDLGNADEIHGGSGDDTVYGMTGADILFGDGQDDDVVGGYGADWISAGTGNDGVLGDDGRISTSRNGLLGESLYGVAPFASSALNLLISTPGNIQQATINVSGALKKTVNITPFNLTPVGQFDDPLFAPVMANDIIYGGLGDDFLHGAAGDDAISGAEAQASFFDTAINPGNVLHFGDHTRAGEFLDYNEFEPLVQLPTFVLNFEATEPDGNDALFGDLGNDWIVGGPGRDHMYGGYGNDLLDADDDKTTHGGQNDVPDGPLLSMEDIAFGGAGRDVLYANTGGDRLIDWAGEFNSYLVPFAPFGVATVSRSLQPRLFEYLYDLSKSDGADPTRAADTGNDPLRNGEPDGELGLVKQQDGDWHDQTGAPIDPQPGNIPGGRRDVLRGAGL